jgi:Predicted membrane protein (DUF2243)
MEPAQRSFPKSAGILFGLGLGGFFDGIVLHQLLQWHHMLSSWYPVDTIENVEWNTLWDGIFHSSTYFFVVAGLFVLWLSAGIFSGRASCLQERCSSASAANSRHQARDRSRQFAGVRPPRQCLLLTRHDWWGTAGIGSPRRCHFSDRAPAPETIPIMS